MSSYENIEDLQEYYQDIKNLIQFDAGVRGKSIEKIDDVQEIYITLFKSKPQTTKLTEKLEKWGGNDNPNALQNLRRLAVVLYIQNIECQFALQTEKSISSRLHTNKKDLLEDIKILEIRMLEKDLKIESLSNKIQEIEDQKNAYIKELEERLALYEF